MVLISGIELSKNHVLNKRSAHVLGLGVTDYLSADGDVIELAKKLRNQGALSIAAHPVSTRKMELQTFHLWDRREELKSHFDAWEVASGPYLFDEVVNSKLPVIANSDFHSPFQLQSWKTVFYCEKHPEAILNSVKKQDIGLHFYKM